MPRHEQEPTLPLREHIQATEQAAWTDILGRYVDVPELPLALSERVLPKLAELQFQPLYLPSLNSPNRASLAENGEGAFTEEVTKENPALFQTRGQVRYVRAVAQHYREKKIRGEIVQAGKWVAIENWNGLTEDELDTVPDRRSLLLADRRYGLPLTRFLYPDQQEHRDEEKGDQSADTKKELKKTLTEIGISTPIVTAPSVIDSFLLARRGLWIPSEDGEWTNTMHSLDESSDSSYCYYVATGRQNDPQLKILEGAAHYSSVGLRPMLMF